MNTILTFWLLYLQGVFFLHMIFRPLKIFTHSEQRLSGMQQAPTTTLSVDSF